MFNNISQILNERKEDLCKSYKVDTEKNVPGINKEKGTQTTDLCNRDDSVNELHTHDKNPETGLQMDEEC